jgi:AcrR family transcriptional regulator
MIREVREAMTVTAVKNEQDPRVKRTRLLLQQALAALFNEKPFEAISVQDITERATVNRATFYAHYQDKFDLADRMARELFQKHLTGSLQMTSPVTEDTLRTLCLAVFDFLVKAYGHSHMDRQMSSLLERALHETLHQFITTWLSQGAPHTKAAPSYLDTAALTVSSALIGVGLHWIQGKRKQHKDDLAKQVVAVLAPGVVDAARGLR